MKKLMIAAAVAAMAAGSFAASEGCGLEPTPVPEVKGAWAWAYNWRFVGRTTAGQLFSTADIVLPGSACGLGGGTVTGVTECVRVPYTLDIQGYTYMCDPICHACTIKDDSETTPTSDFLGDSWATKQFAMFKPTYGYVNMEDGSLKTDVAWPIGTRGEYFEVHGNAVFPVYIAAETIETFTLDFAGLGNYGVYGKMKLPGTISGNFSGKVDATYFVSMKVCAKSHPWNCCRTGLLMDEYESIAYGNWAAKFNASASANYVKGITVNMPDWWKAKAKEVAANY